MALLTQEKAILFQSPESDGVIRVQNYFSDIELSNIQSELTDPDKVQWRLTDENHFSYALKLDRGDQTQFQDLGPIRLATEKMQRTVRGLSRFMPHLFKWSPNELALQKYNQPSDLGPQRAPERFVGMIAIGVIEGISKFAIYRDAVTSLCPTVPGDLILLRAPKQGEKDERIRPEHAVIEIEDFPRTSLMLRSSTRPDEVFPHYIYANWP